MEPTITNGYECLCDKKLNYSVGDIVYYKIILDGKMEALIHRIISMDNNFVWTKGDNNLFVDYQPVPIQDIGCSIPETTLHELISKKF